MEKEDKLVSIIIPCYNGEKVISHSIESVYYQEYQRIELIVVDDGSTDKSRENILAWEERFIKRGATLKYIFEKNRGLGGAIDTGLKYVTGDYLTLLDADDRYLPGSICKRVCFLDNNLEFAGVRSNGWYVRGNERTLFITSDKEKQITDLFTALTFGKTNNWAGTYMVRTKILFEAYPDRNIFPSRFGQNFQILLPVSYKRKFGYIDEPLMDYYIQENSLSNNSEPELQYRLSENNSKGWREIYLRTLEQIATDPQDYKAYMNGYNSVYYRGGLHRAAIYHKEDALRAYYKLLISTGLATLNDRIIFYSEIRSPIAIILKILRRIKMLFKLV